MGNQTIQDNLEEILRLLQKVDEMFWVKKIERVLLSNSLGGGIGEGQKEEIRSWFGGMGSINDLVLSPYNGHSLTERDEAKLNHLLQEELTNLYELVNSR